MSYIQYSTIKGIILAGIVIFAGTTVGYFFLPKKDYLVVDLEVWVNKEDVLPSYISFWTMSIVLEIPTLYNRTVDFEVILPETSTQKEWVLYSHSIINRTDPHGHSTSSHIFPLSNDTINTITDAFRTTIHSALTGERMSYDEFLKLRMKYFEKDEKRFYVSSIFVGTDDIIVFLEIMTNGLAVYACTMEQMRDETSSGFVTPVENAHYYFLRTQSFEEAMTTSYITTWNTTLQTLFTQGASSY